MCLGSVPQGFYYYQNGIFMLSRIRKNRFSDFCVLVLVLCALSGVAHLWIAEKQQLHRYLYNVEAYFSTFTLRCNDSAPEWIKELALDGIYHRGALANQIAYVSAEGALSYCSTGWKKSFLGGERVNENTRFRYASLTKVITADVILSLALSGKLRLDSNLGEIFPEIKSWSDYRVAEITVEQLLNHTAGFDRLASGDAMFLKNKKPWCPYNIENISSLKLSFSPGEKQVYSNLGYCILGVIAELAMEAPFRKIVEDNYGIARMGMTFVDGGQLSDEVIPDFRNDDYYYQDYYKYYDFFAASSSVGLSGSAASLALLVHRLFSKDKSLLGSASSYEGCNASVFRGCYAHALYIYRAVGNDFSVYIHEGYLPGSSNVLFVDESGGVLVFLSAGSPLNIMEENKKTYEKIYASLLKNGSVK